MLIKLKNRYILSTLIALVYVTLLHNTDVYTLIQRNKKVTALSDEIEHRKTEIKQMRENLEELQDLRSLEKYARETHLFKKDDEDVFIFSFE